jgi:hypothetical protein
MSYSILRKTDFQREMKHWTPEKIATFIQSFLEGDLIPAVILWRSPTSGNLFVIDGAHRLSALIAWVQDDYGDGKLSERFFSGLIPPAQTAAAKAARKEVERAVGSYKDLQSLLTHYHGDEDRHRVLLARNLNAFGIRLQWVPGDAAKAEKSFFAINQQATPIDPTELRMIQERRQANALAARALIRAGTGHKYWSAFKLEKQRQVEDLAREIYDALFVPDLETPIKTLDLPVAGRGYTADSVKMIFDFVNFVNRDRIRPSGDQSQNDPDGEQTISYLKRVRKVVSMISGEYPGSLGLHPAVYFYSATGRYQPAAFLATVSFIQDLDSRGRFSLFSRHRDRFEEFLLTYKHFVNQIGQKYGSEDRGVNPLTLMLQTVFNSVVSGKDFEVIVSELQSTDKLRFLSVVTDDDKVHGRNFSGHTKAAAFLRAALDGAPRCNICNARVHRNSISFDHIVRKPDGGWGDASNAALTHFYCNTGYKEQLLTKEAW